MMQNSLEGTWDKNGKYDLKNGTLNRHTFNAVIVCVCVCVCPPTYARFGFCGTKKEPKE